MSLLTDWLADLRISLHASNVLSASSLRFTGSRTSICCFTFASTKSFFRFNWNKQNGANYYPTHEIWLRLYIPFRPFAQHTSCNTEHWENKMEKRCEMNGNVIGRFCRYRYYYYWRKKWHFFFLLQSQGFILPNATDDNNTKNSQIRCPFRLIVKRNTFECYLPSILLMFREIDPYVALRPNLNGTANGRRPTKRETKKMLLLVLSSRKSHPKEDRTWTNQRHRRNMLLQFRFKREMDTNDVLCKSKHTTECCCAAKKTQRIFVHL